MDLGESFSSLPPPRLLLKECRAAGFLRSTGITPLHRYCEPIRHPLAFGPLPIPVIGPTLLHRPFAGGREGLLQLLSDALLPCCRFHPAQVPPPFGWFDSEKCCLRLLNTGSALRFVNNETTFAFTHRCGPEARSPRFTGLCRWAPRSRFPYTSPSKLRGHQLLPRRDSHPIVITCLNLDTHSSLTPSDPLRTQADRKLI